MVQHQIDTGCVAQGSLNVNPWAITANLVKKKNGSCSGFWSMWSMWLIAAALQILTQFPQHIAELRNFLAAS